MYIEMTTFSIPTFVLEIAKALSIFALVWIVFVAIGIWVYGYMWKRNERTRARIDAQIDRLHK